MSDEGKDRAVDIGTKADDAGEVEGVPTVPGVEVKARVQSSPPSSDPLSLPGPQERRDTHLNTTTSESVDTPQMIAEPILRRSTRVSRPPREFWISPSHDAHIQ